MPPEDESATEAEDTGIAADVVQAKLDAVTAEHALCGPAQDELVNQLNAAKAANYDLLIATPGTEEVAADPSEDADILGTEDLFGSDD